MRRSELAPKGAALAGAALLATLAFGSGGYFPADWGLVLLACALVAAAAFLLRDDLDAGRLDLAFSGGLSAFAAWTLLSTLWAESAGPVVYDGELAVVYAAAASALLVAVPARAVDVLPLGVFAAALAISLYGLAAHLFPADLGRPYDPYAHYQVDQPIGYSNASGIVALVGLLLAFGFALRGGRVERIVGAAALVPLGAVLFLTFSRGALLAFGVTLPLLLVLGGSGREAARAAMLALPSLLGVVAVVRTPAVFERPETLDAAATAGHRLTAVLAVLTLAAAVVAALEGRMGRVPQARRVVAGVVAAAVLVIALIVLAGPTTLAHRAIDAFRLDPPAVSGELGRRLLTAYGNRPDYWRVALDTAERHPLVGAGGGMYERLWLRERPVDEGVRNAHSLYLETLAELGTVGLALLLAALAVPIVALVHVRTRWPLAPACGAAYVAFLVHAGLDWDWELPAVTLLGLACGVALVVAARPAGVIALTPVRRALGLSAVVPVMVLAVVAHVGNRAAQESTDALVRDDVAGAAGKARRAIGWQPWSGEGWLLLGRAQLSAGDERAARASLRRALDRDAGDWLTWYTLAAASRGAEASRALDRAQRLNPRSAEIAELRAALRTKS